MSYVGRTTVVFVKKWKWSCETTKNLEIPFLLTQSKSPRKNNQENWQILYLTAEKAKWQWGVAQVGWIKARISVV